MSPKPGDPGTVTVTGNRKVADVLREDGFAIVFDPYCPQDEIFTFSKAQWDRLLEKARDHVETVRIAAREYAREKHRD